MSEFKKKFELNNDNNADSIFGGSDNYHQISYGSGYWDEKNHESGFCISGFISKSNAILISKAPEMLEMLMTIENDKNQVPEWLWDKIQTLIKEATTL